MSWKEFEENCAGCRPCVIDLKTGRPMDPDTEIMRAVNSVWEGATIQEKRAFHNVTCNNSKRDEDVEPALELTYRIQKELSKLD